MNITNTSDIHQERVKLLIYGQTGIGKTYQIRFLPEDKTLIIAAEPGLMTLKNTKFDVVDITKRKNKDGEEENVPLHERPAILKQVFEELVNDPANKDKYEYIVLDSLTEIAESILASEEIKNKDDKNGYKVWGEYAKRLVGTLKAFRDMPHYNVIFTALEEFTEDDSKRLIFRPSMPGKAAHKACAAAFDFVLRLTVNNEGKREFQTQASRNAIAKTRGVMLPNPMEANLGKLIEEIRKNA